MTLPNIGSKRVEGEGPLDAKIAVIGEAPGRDEETEGRPFVGSSGQLMERYFGRIGIAREDLYIDNLCKRRPKNNNFSYLVGSDVLEQDLEELKQTLEKIRPHVIIAFGNWPLHYLTGLGKVKGKKITGIGTYRGAIAPCSFVEGLKVLPTYHPASIVRAEGYKNNPIFFEDIKKAIRESAYPELRVPQYEEFVDPTGDILENLVREMSEAEWLSYDIENFEGGQLSCVGFADSPERGLCITFKHPEGWEPVKRLLLSNAKKIPQFGAYDTMFLHYHYGFEVKNYAFDTFIAAASLMPDFPRGLDFLSSLYTDFPFYKEEKKTWKETGDMSTLWSYNIKDVIATYIIAMKQLEELEELFGKEAA